MPDLADLLIQLQENVSRYPTRAIFRPPASDDEIAAAEAAMDVGFPESYRRFLTTFNGGFISLCGDSSETDWNERNAAWNSNLLFGTERIVKEYTRWRQIWQFDMGWSGDWPYVPFCQTEGQELLVFAPPDSDPADSRVLDAFHEVPPEEWSMVYESFTALLAAYLENDGRITTIGSS